MPKKRIPKPTGTYAERWRSPDILATGKFRVHWPGRYFAVLELHGRPVIGLDFGSSPTREVKLAEDITPEEHEDIFTALLQVCRMFGEGYFDRERMKAPRRHNEQK